MKSTFPPEHEQFRQRVRAFVEQALLPRAAAWEAAGEFPRSVLEDCARQNMLPSDPFLNAILAEELPRCESLGFALSVFVQTNIIGPLLESFGTPEQRDAFLPALRAGRMMGALAVTEPQAGSDLGGLACLAELSGGRLVLHGEKTYITNAAYADFLIVGARTPQLSEDGLTLLLVPAKDPGVCIERLRSLGLNVSGPGRIRFDGCHVSPSAVLGKPGEGLGLIQGSLNRERLFGGIACVAWAELAMRRTIAFARERKAFGNTINRFQAVRHQFAEMATRLEAARCLNHETFLRWARGESVTREICMIKLFSYPSAQQVIAECLQLHGGLGYLENHWTSRFYRDACALTIAAGTPQVMKEMIAAYLRV